MVWTVDAAAAEGMGTMRQRNLNAQCERNRMRQGWGELQAPPCSVLSLCVVYFLSFYSISVQLFLAAFLCVFFVRLLHLSRFVWFAQKQIAGSMQMHDAAYQILFESLDLPWRLTATQCSERVQGCVGGGKCGLHLALICLAKGAWLVGTKVKGDSE